MAYYGFAERLEISRGIREATDMETIERLLAGCVHVVKTGRELDRQGVDYIATLRGGSTVLIDAKTRTPGCSLYWEQGPELALEIYSVCPDDGRSGKVGWTLNEASNVDYILFTFDPIDTKDVYLYPFQLLRTCFRRNLGEWKGRYETGHQKSDSWRSECIFVPEFVVWEAVRNCTKVRV